jgi:hypothetical protein
MHPTTTRNNAFRAKNDNIDAQNPHCICHLCIDYAKYNGQFFLFEEIILVVDTFILFK